MMKAKYKKDFTPFFGQYEATVLSDGRVILPAKVRKQLLEHGAKKVWLGKMPDVKALVVCPDTLWNHWLDTEKRRHKFLRTPVGARTVLAASEPVAWDRKGRIYLPVQLCNYAHIEPGQAVYCIGLGDHFEIWNKKIFYDMANDDQESPRD